MKAKTKNTWLIRDYIELDDVLFSIASLSLKVDKKDYEMNAEILRLKDKYEPEIQVLQNNIKDLEEQVEYFLKAHKKDFETKRSRTLTYGRVGYHSGKDTLKPLKKSFTWEMIKLNFQQLFGARYVETKVVFNKSKAIADARKGVLTDQLLAAANVKLTKSESTFYEIFREKIEVEEKGKK